MGRLPEAWIAPPGVRGLREAVRHRCKLVALRSGLKAQVHAVLARQGLRVAVADLLSAAGRRRSTSCGWTRRSPPGLRRCCGGRPPFSARHRYPVFPPIPTNRHASTVPTPDSSSRQYSDSIANQ